MVKMIERTQARQRRHFRMRTKVVGTPGRPRLSVFRSEKNIFAQIIDDTRGVTLVSLSTLNKDMKPGEKDVKPVESARLVGKLLAAKAAEKNIAKVVFDKSGYQYHGRVRALADGAREGGLKF